MICLKDKAIRIASEAARGGVFIFTGNTLSTIILGIASIIIARLLGPNDYGLYSVVFIIPSLMMIFVNPGITSAIIKFLAQFRYEKKYDELSDIIRIGVLFELFMSLAIFSITFLLARELAVFLLKRGSTTFLVRIASFVILGQALFAVSNSVFIGLDRMENSAIISIIQALVKSILGPLLIVIGLGVFGVIIGHMTSYAIAGLIGGILVLKLYRGINKSNNKRFFLVLKMMILYGIPLYGSTLLISISGQYSSIILAWFASNTEIGNYSVATKFASLIGLLTTPIATALFPAFSKLSIKTDNEEIKKFVWYSLKYILLLLVPSAMLVITTSKELISILFGSKYILAPIYLVIFSLIFFYSGFNVVLRNFFNGIGRTDISFRATLVNVTILVPLVFILTQRYSVIGLIISTIISGITSVSYLFKTAIANYNLKINACEILKIYSIAIIAGIFALIFSYVPITNSLLKLLIKSTVFIASYLTLLPLSQAIDNRDIVNIEKIFGKIKVISKILLPIVAYERKILRS